MSNNEKIKIESPKPIVKVNNWTFFVNPKCGIRTVHTICRELNKLPKEIFNEKKNILIYRDPYNKLISGYLNKYVQHNKYFKFLEKYNIKKDDVNTFSKFINIIDKRGITVLNDQHFRLQVSILNNNVKIDNGFLTEEIYKLITFLNNNIEKFDKSLLLKNDNFEFFKVTNHKSKHDVKFKYNLEKKPHDLNREELLNLIKKNKIPDYKLFYNEKLKKIVHRHYLKDFQFIKNLNL